jgi:parallel beta-helix repeat protein
VGGDSLLVEPGDRLIGDPVRMAPAPEGGLGKVLTSVPTKIVGHNSTAVLFVARGARATFENLDISGATAREDARNGGRGVWLRGSTIRFSRIHDNQGAGIANTESGFLVEDSEVFRNGSAEMEGNNASGMKISDPRGLAGGGTVQRTYVHDNFGNGLWTDCGSRDVTFQDNTVVRNSRKGIFVEISAGPINVLRNVVKENNRENQNNGGGIAVMSSMRVRIENNTLANNGRAGINIATDARASSPESRACRHGFLPSDIVVSGNSVGGDRVLGCSQSGLSCSGNGL